jgi:hypothetical protein
MPVHDWTRVEAGIFHDFHTVWIAEIRNALNRGLLPPGYYALAEQHAGHYVTDVLTLLVPSPSPPPPLPEPDDGVGIAVAEAPPKVRRTVAIDPVELARVRTLTIRHVSGHHLVALLGIVSPANKDRREEVEAFVEKAVTALRLGVNLLVVDLFPPSPHDPHGMPGAIGARFRRSDDDYQLPPGEPFTLASYATGPRPSAYLEHLAVGAALPEMPLFLRPGRYVNVPLGATYQTAYEGMPPFWRDVLEGRVSP